MRGQDGLLNADMVKVVTGCKTSLPTSEESRDLYHPLYQDTAEGMATREIRGKTKELKHPSENHTSNANVRDYVCST